MQARARWKRGELAPPDYEAFLREQTAACVRLQEDLGLDVLVHGEFERNDMVEYFGEQLEGFAFTAHGWVQSYGSRCVKPPVIYGDVSRPAPITVPWSAFAQSLTTRPLGVLLRASLQSDLARGVALTDGLIGTLTRRAIVAEQQRLGITPADGRAGRKILNALERDRPSSSVRP